MVVVVSLLSCKSMSMHLGKNVTLEIETIHIIEGYQHKTRQNFSQTLNEIVKQWDKFSLEIEKYKKQQETKQGLKHFDDLKKAKVVK